MTRWNRRLLLGAIAVLLPALAGCEAGLNAPTLEFHPASSGVSTMQNGITVDNVFVLGAPLGSALPPGGRASVFLALEAENGDRGSDKLPCEYSASTIPPRIPVERLPDQKAKANFTPNKEAVAAMAKYNEELAKAGVLVSLEGLHPVVSGGPRHFPRWRDRSWRSNRSMKRSPWRSR